MTFRAEGESMLPSLVPGDKLTVRKTAGVSLGDILLTKTDGSLLNHRLIGKYTSGKKAYYVSKGDALPQSDPPVPQKSVLGVVINLQRGRKIISLTTPPSRMRSLVLALFSKMEAKAPRAAKLLRGLTNISPFIDKIVKRVLVYR